MSTELKLPGLGPDDAGVTLLKWHVQAGDAISPGDLLAELESDKTIVEFEAQEAGVITELKIAEGSEGVRSGDVLAMISANGSATAEPAITASTERAEDLPATAEPAPAAEQPVEAAVEAAPATPPSSAATPESGATAMATAIATQTGASISDVAGTGDQGRVTARDLGVDTAPNPGGTTPSSLSALAERMLEMTGQSPAAFNASGPGNRLTARDIGIAFEKPDRHGAIAGTAPDATSSADPDLDKVTAEFTEVPAGGVKRATARRLAQSKRDAPHYYMSMDMCVDELISWRAVLNETRKDDARISVNDIIVKMVAAALKREPSLNAAWTGDAVRHYSGVDIAVAVASDRGLMTPVIRNAHTLSLDDIHFSIAELAKRAAEGKLAPSELQGGTFTISNLGMFGVSDFSAIINPPQAAILAVAASRLVAVPVSAEPDSGTVNRSMMTCTLSVDHRAADGVDGARYLNALKEIVEDPRRLLL